jgi:hypothetical protein
MTEYERLVQDRRDADRARNNDWKARALAAEAERDMLVEGIKNNIERQRADKAEAALREIIDFPYIGQLAAIQMRNIARAALEGK